MKPQTRTRKGDCVLVLSDCHGQPRLRRKVLAGHPQDYDDARHHLRTEAALRGVEPPWTITREDPS